MTIGIIGCGVMGGAIATALAEGPDTVIACDHHREHVEATGARFVGLDELLAASDIAIIAIKPQGIPALLPTLAASKVRGWISIAAGIDLDTLARGLGTQAVVRFMPNIAAREKRSVTAVCRRDTCPAWLAEQADAIARRFGTAVPLDESLIPAFTGISGSGIAYMFQFIHAMALGGTRAGIAYPKSVRIVSDTLKSAIALLDASNENPVALMTGVCSASGTTIEGIDALAQGAFDATVIAAVTRSADKGRGTKK